MYRPLVRVRGIDCIAWALWLVSGALFLGVTTSVDYKAGFATAAILVGMMAAATIVVAALHRTEERMSDQMTIEHRAQASSGPTPLSQVR